MNFYIKTTILATAGLMLSLSHAPSAMAYTVSSAIHGGYTGGGHADGSSYLAGRDTGTYSQGKFLDGSSTANHFYKVGVTRFNKGKYDRAEVYFKAVLRADGLDKQAYFYLAKIKEAQGERQKANEYAQAYFSIK